MNKAELEVGLAGLAGCGGAGFPTSFKWNAVAGEVAGDGFMGGKVVVCNADEGEPGTFKDGWLLRERPLEVLRGMVRAAEFVGAGRAFIYLRPEYGAQRAALGAAIGQMVAASELAAGSGAVWQGDGFPGRPAKLAGEESGLGGVEVGSDMALASLDWHLGHGLIPEEGATPRAAVGGPRGERRFPLPPERLSAEEMAALQGGRNGAVGETGGGGLVKLDLCMGGGAYICGEETAMLESMEGRRPQPRHKPPFPTQCGLWSLPTLVNNVETFWWAERLLGGDVGPWAEGEALRLYSLSGDVVKPGIYEAPVGITARQLVEEFGGGVQDGAKVQCFIPGGAATGVLPASCLDTPLSPAGLKEVGTALGTAGVVIYTQESGRQVTEKIMRFFAQESCTQCTPCRIGCSSFADDLNGPPDDWLVALEKGSICGLGFTAPLAVYQYRRWFKSAGVGV